MLNALLQLFLALGRSVEIILRLLVRPGFLELHAQANAYWQEFDQWLDDNGLTFGQFIFHALRMLFSMLVLGGLVSGTGLLIASSTKTNDFWIIGQIIFSAMVLLIALGWLTARSCRQLPYAQRFFLILGLLLAAFLGYYVIDGIFTLWNTNPTGFLPASALHVSRAFMLAGLMISWFAVLPFVALLLVARKLFNLIFNTGKVALEELHDLPADVRGRWESRLAQYQGKSSLLPLILGLYAVYTTFTLLMMGNPSSGSLTFAMYITAASLVVIVIRQSFGVLGYEIRKAIWAGAVSILMFAVPIWWIVPMLFEKFMHTPLKSIGIDTHSTGWLIALDWFRLIAAAIVAVVAFLYFLRNSIIKAEQQEFEEGRAPIEKHKRRVTGFDGEGQPIYGVTETKSTSAATVGGASPSTTPKGSRFWDFMGGVGKLIAFLFILAAYFATAIFLQANYFPNNTISAFAVPLFVILILAGAWWLVHNEKAGVLGLFALATVVVMLITFMNKDVQGAFSNQPQTVVTRPSVVRTPGSNTRPADLVAIADRNADAYNIEHRFVYAIIDVESGWNPSAVSSDGAQGLMQLMPDTARRFGVGNSYDPGQNVEGGCKYLWFLLNRYNGDVATTLIGYHSGEGEADKYVGQQLTPSLINQLSPRAQMYVLAVFNRYASLGTSSGGGQFVRSTPNNSTPKESIVEVSEDGNEVKVIVRPFNQAVVTLPPGDWKLYQNEGGMPWAAMNNGDPSRAYNPGQKCHAQNNVLVPGACLGDTVISVNGLARVYDLSDTITCTEPTKILVGHNFRKGDENKKLSSKAQSYYREITLRKEG